MSRKSETLLHQTIPSESGQTVVWTALLFALLLGVGGLVVDIGRGYISYRELQASTDAAALAAASQLPITTSNESSNTVSSTATKFSSVSGNNNAYANLNTPIAMTGAAITVTPGCVSEANLPQCTSTLLANAVQVTQTVTIPTMFIRALSVLGIQSANSLTLTASATAQMRGAQRGPYNVAIVMDATGSMSYPDGGSNCTGTKAQCAEQGAQILLSEFSPCLPGLSNCGAVTSGNVVSPVDEVSFFTFPASSAGSQVSFDETCNATQTTTNPWPYPLIAYPDSTTYGTVSHTSPTMPTITTANLNTLVSQYQVVPLSSNYRTSDSPATGTSPLTIASSGVSTTNPSIVNAVGGNTYFGGSGCTGTYVCQQYTNGGKACVSTYFAGALFTAQEYLANNARANATNVIILLSDGDANGGTMSSSKLSGNGTYPDNNDQCRQAVDVASAAKAAGTRIYTVGYGVARNGCETDGGDGPTACKTLQQIASSNTDFFVDTSSVSCAGATSVTMNGGTNTLSAIFTAIAGDLTLPRLLPNNTPFTAMSS